MAVVETAPELSSVIEPPAMADHVNATWPFPGVAVTPIGAGGGNCAPAAQGSCNTNLTASATTEVPAAVPEFEIVTLPAIPSLKLYIPSKTH